MAVPMSIENELDRLAVTEASIGVLAEKYRRLEVKGLDDKKGFEEVRAARIDTWRRGVQVEKARKACNEEAQTHIKGNNTFAKRIQALLAPILEPLKDSEDWYNAEHARLKREEEERKAAATQARFDALAAVGVTMPSIYQKITGESFADILADATMVYAENQLLLLMDEANGLNAEHDAEVARVAEACRVEAQRAENARVAEELRKKESKLQEAKDKLAADEKALEDRAAAVVAEEAQRFKDAKNAEDLKEKLAKEAKEKVEREASETKQREDDAATEVLRKEALLPDQIKLRTYAAALTNLVPPEMATEAGAALLERTRESLVRLSNKVTRDAEEL